MVALRYYCSKMPAEICDLGNTNILKKYSNLKEDKVSGFCK